MSAMLRILKTLVVAALACTAGILPACGTMGGGMHYLADPAIVAGQATST